jgi:hypothetical protein
MREYKIYLPLKYNDGAPIEEEKFRNIKLDLVTRFGAITVSSLSAPYQGTWKYGGVEFLDDIITIEVVASDNRATKKFFKDLKERLKKELHQIDILITTHGIQVI